MREESRHILFLATEFDAPGMHPYAINIINTMWQPGDHVLIVTRYGVDAQAFPEIPEDSITWIDYPVSKWAKAVFRFRPKIVLQAVDDIVGRKNIKLLFSLTEEIILADSIRHLQRQVPVLYTVHDATFHDYKSKSLVRWLKDRLIIARPQRLMLERTCYQVTNSRDQLEQMINRFPDHQVHYAPFPTLVNESIARGGKPVKELQGEGVSDGYILFFGTIHFYKGLHLLYDAYFSHPELQTRPLVIAGTRNIYFARRAEEKGVFLINRFIDDSEVRDLFGRAAVVVYPYVSATQSGVTSIASYFGKPMVLSDLPFFKQTCEGCEGVEFFPTGDRQALAMALERALEVKSVSTRNLYDREYAPQAMRASLNAIINSISSSGS